MIVRCQSRSLCTGTESSRRNRVLGEVEKDSLVALPGKVDIVDSYPQKLSVPTWENLVRNFIAMVQGWGR